MVNFKTNIPNYENPNGTIFFIKDEVESVFCVKFSELADPVVQGHTQFRVEV